MAKAVKLAKLTSKNQLTLPKAVVEAMGTPTHFRVQVHEGVLLLWPGRLVAGPEEVARRMAREGEAAPSGEGAREGR